MQEQQAIIKEIRAVIRNGNKNVFFRPVVFRLSFFLLILICLHDIRNADFTSSLSLRSSAASGKQRVVCIVQQKVEKKGLFISMQPSFE